MPLSNPETRIHTAAHRKPPGNPFLLCAVHFKPVRQVISFAPPGGGLLASAAEGPPAARSGLPLQLGRAAKPAPPPPQLAGAEDEERRQSYARQIERLRSEIMALKQEIEGEKVK